LMGRRHKKREKKKKGRLKDGPRKKKLEKKGSNNISLNGSFDNERFRSRRRRIHGVARRMKKEKKEGK